MDPPRAEGERCACSGRLLLFPGRHALLGQLGQRGEGSGVVDGEIREDLAADLATGDLEALNEPVVGHAVLPGGRVDAAAPQLTEVAVTGTAVPVGVVERVERLLLGLTVEPRT